MMSETKRFLLCLLAAVAMCALVHEITSTKIANAGSTGSTYQLQVATTAPVYRDIITSTGFVGTDPILAIANASSTSEHVYYKYRFTNTSAAGTNACFFYVTTATDCTAQTARGCDEATITGTLVAVNGFVVVPGAPVEQVVEGTRRICAVGSASPTKFHVDRMTVE